MELTEEQQENYEIAKREISKAMMPMEFVSLDVFHRRKLQPGEALSVFVHDLKKLLEQAMPGLNAAARDPLLLHQFISGLPEAMSRQLRASGETTSLDAAVNRARLLMTIEGQGQAAVAVTKDAEVEHLREQVALLTEQVATLSTGSQSAANQQRLPRCYMCSQLGHIRRDCPRRRRPYCFNCQRTGHLARDCFQAKNYYQGNGRGMHARGGKHPSQQ